MTAECTNRIGALNDNQIKIIYVCKINAFIVYLYENYRFAHAIISRKKIIERKLKTVQTINLKIVQWFYGFSENKIKTPKRLYKRASCTCTLNMTLTITYLYIIRILVFFSLRRVKSSRNGYIFTHCTTHLVQYKKKKKN